MTAEKPLSAVFNGWKSARFHPSQMQPSWPLRWCQIEAFHSAIPLISDVLRTLYHLQVSRSSSCWPEMPGQVGKSLWLWKHRWAALCSVYSLFSSLYEKWSILISRPCRVIRAEQVSAIETFFSNYLPNLTVSGQQPGWLILPTLVFMTIFRSALLYLITLLIVTS